VRSRTQSDVTADFLAAELSGGAGNQKKKYGEKANYCQRRTDWPFQNASGEHSPIHHGAVWLGGTDLRDFARGASDVTNLSAERWIRKVNAKYGTGELWRRHGHPAAHEDADLVRRYKCKNGCKHPGGSERFNTDAA
jgi:hypothetical protein